MLVHVVAETGAKLATLRRLLAAKHKITCGLLGEVDQFREEFDAIVFDVDLRAPKNIAALKALTSCVSRISTRIFLVDQRTRLLQVQALALGATHTLSNPLDSVRLLARLSEIASPSIDFKLAGGSLRQVASEGAASLASMFSAVLGGRPIDVPAVKNSGYRIVNSIAENGLSNWLETVRRHHEGTYQHCLLVTGIAVDFGLSLGMTKLDIGRLHTAAMFHDIGKARIPLAVLDKPTKLDDSERALIETHPEVGYEALRGTPGIEPEILDAVRHHHEFLDGSGYPDGLYAGGIADLVRMLTISDIFAALIEHRSYKLAMPREKAYERLLAMKGKLESPLVDAFRTVALSR